jgi:hypothetical protein
MFELVGAAANDLEIAKIAASLSGTLGDRIKKASVLLKPDTEMPRRSDGGPSYGFWKSGPREIWLWDETDEYPVTKTFAHEAMHVIDSDWLTRAQRVKLMTLMSPAPTAWSDQKIDGILHKYVALPSEVFAVYASAAVAGLQRPAYRSLFRRRITPDKWAELKELTLHNDGPAQPEADAHDAVPSPPDPLDDVGAQLEAANKDVADALSAKKTAEVALADVADKLFKAKSKAAEISQL